MHISVSFGFQMLKSIHDIKTESIPKERQLRLSIGKLRGLDKLFVLSITTFLMRLNHLLNSIVSIEFHKVKYAYAWDSIVSKINH